MSGTRPKVGFNPQTPHQAAGSRMLPPESLPSARSDAPAATTAAAPEDEPPGARVASRGLTVRPCAGLSASAVVIPVTTAPAARKRATAVASRSGRRSRCSADDPATGHPSTSIQSLTVIGTPSSGRAVPARRRASLVVASARVRSGSRAATAPKAARTRSSRARWSCATSTADTSRLRRADASATAERAELRQGRARHRARRGTAGGRRPAARPDRESRRAAGGTPPRHRVRTARCRPCGRRLSCCARCSAASVT